MERISKIDYKGSPIVVLDYRDCSREEYVRVYEEFVALVKKAPDASLNLLTDFHSDEFDADLANLWKGSAELFQKKVRKSAVYGFSTLDLIRLSGYRAYLRLIGQKVGDNRAVSFSSREKALDWLVSP